MKWVLKMTMKQKVLSQSEYNIKKKISLVNFTDKNDIKRIKYIVIHYFGGLTTAENISDYWYDTYAGTVCTLRC
jgi:hypothetical protein